MDATTKRQASQEMNTRSERVNNYKGGQEGGSYQIQYHHHDHHRKPSIPRIAIVVSFVVLSFLILHHSVYPIQHAFNTSYNGLVSSLEENSSSQSLDPATKETTSVSSLVVPLGLEEVTQLNRLKKLLRKTAMPDKTVILTTLNKAWAAPNAMFDIFLESFRFGNQTQHLLDHLIVITLDQIAYSRCKLLHRHCYILTTKDIDFTGEARYMTDVYLKMMWIRIDFLRTVLELGYNFIFTDVDVLWFRDPFLHFYPDADFQIACDHYNHNASDLNNELNGGFNYVKSNDRTIQFYRFFYKAKDEYPGKHDQDVLNIIKFDPFISHIGMQIKFLDTAYYSGFCEPSKDLNEVCTMHATCVIGLEQKLGGLKMILDDWKSYMSLPSSQMTSKPIPWSANTMLYFYKIYKFFH